MFLGVLKTASLDALTTLLTRDDQAEDITEPVQSVLGRSVQNMLDEKRAESELAAEKEKTRRFRCIILANGPWKGYYKSYSELYDKLQEKRKELEKEKETTAKPGETLLETIENISSLMAPEDLITKDLEGQFEHWALNGDSASIQTALSKFPALPTLKLWLTF